MSKSDMPPFSIRITLYVRDKMVIKTSMEASLAPISRLKLEQIPY